jgi:hypothetical protein
MKNIYANFLFWLENYLQKRGKKFKNKKKNLFVRCLKFLDIYVFQKYFLPWFNQRISQAASQFMKPFSQIYEEYTPAQKRRHWVFLGLGYLLMIVIFAIAMYRGDGKLWG